MTSGLGIKETIKLPLAREKVKQIPDKQGSARMKKPEWCAPVLNHSTDVL
jgi:hypothetical protein